MRIYTVNEALFSPPYSVYFHLPIPLVGVLASLTLLLYHYLFQTALLYFCLLPSSPMFSALPPAISRDTCGDCVNNCPLVRFKKAKPSEAQSKTAGLFKYWKRQTERQMGDGGRGV